MPYPYPHGYRPPPPHQPPIAGLATAGFVVSLVACGLVGLVLSIVALGQVERSGGALRGGGLARAGVIVGFVHLVIEVVIGVMAVRGGNG